MVELAKSGVASTQSSDAAVAALKQAQARVDSLQKQVQSAQSDLASTQARVNQANAAVRTVDAMRGQAQTAQAQIAEADARLAYTKVLAPVSGIVSVRAAREGEVVNVSTPIVTIVDLNDTWVRAAVPETYGEKVAIGDILPVRLPSGSEVQGRVIFKAVEGDLRHAARREPHQARHQDDRLEAAGRQQPAKTCPRDDRRSTGSQRRAEETDFTGQCSGAARIPAAGEPGGAKAVVWVAHSSLCWLEWVCSKVETKTWSPRFKNRTAMAQCRVRRRLRCRTSSRSMATSLPSTTSRSALARAKSSGCSVPTAPASQRSSV